MDNLYSVSRLPGSTVHSYSMQIKWEFVYYTSHRDDIDPQLNDIRFTVFKVHWLWVQNS